MHDTEGMCLELSGNLTCLNKYLAGIFIQLNEQQTIICNAFFRTISKLSQKALRRK